MTADSTLRRRAADLVRAAREIDDDVATRVTVFARLKGGGFEGLSVNATPQLNGEFRAAALRAAANLEDASLVPYQAGRKPDDHEAVYLDPQTVPTLPSIVETLAAGAAGLDAFHHDADEARRARFFVASLGSLDDSFHFFRAMSARSRLGRNKIAALASGDTYTSLEVEPILFDTKIDAVVTEEIAVAGNQREFERTVDFVTEARAAAAETLEVATGNLRIANRDAFIDAASSDLNMIAKLRGIAEKLESDPGYAAAMTMENILRFTDEHPDLEIEIDDVGGEPQLVYHPDPQRRYQILKLLDDDYLHSTITEFDYEANSKRPLA